MKKDWIENLVVSEAIQMLRNDATLDKIMDMVLELQGQENVTLPLLRKQLAETEKNIENMLNAIQQGVLTSSTKSRLEELEASKSETEVKILQEQMQKPLLTREQILFWLHRFKVIDTSKHDQRQRLIDTFVNAIFLYDDKIVLAFNYKDGSKILTLADIEGSDLFGDASPMYDLFGHFRKWSLCDKSRERARQNKKEGGEFPRPSFLFLFLMHYPNGAAVGAKSAPA